MPRITVLDELTANQIAAGEVVERPASVVKELLENALDAGATVITVELTGGGLDKITVTDNGCGMDEIDARLAFQRYATSKIRTAADLEQVLTLGFRGEALASIAAVSDVLLKTRPAGREAGMMLEVRGGEEIAAAPVALAPGTSVTVRELFYNTPARRKHMKSAATEGGLAADMAGRLAMARPGVSILFRHNGREIFRTPGTGKLPEALAAVLGINLVREMVAVAGGDGAIEVSGMAGLPSLHRSSRRHITVFVNGRFIRSPLVTLAVQDAYHTLLPSGRYPVAVISLTVDPELVDVNVHPAKLEVRFARERELAALVTRAVREALRGAVLIPGAVGRGFTAAERPGAPPGEEESRPYLPPRTPAHEQLRLPLTAGAAAPLPPPAAERVAASPPARPEAAAEAGADYAAGRRDFPELRVLAWLAPTYILAAGAGGLYIVDQHAAHERIFYERILHRADGREMTAQMLVQPQLLQLSLREAELLSAHGDLFRSLGFVLEHLSAGAVLLRGLPLDFPDPQSYFRDVLAYLAAPGRAPARRDLLHHLAAEAACRAAVKSGAPQSVQAMAALLEQLAGAESPYTCPHGRPTVIHISRHELAHRFKRT